MTKTKREYFEDIKSKYELTTDEIAFIDHEIELLVKKNSTERKPTATQVENEGIKGSILALMTPNSLYTVTDIMKALDCDLSNQKVSALVNQLADEHKVVKTTDKRKSYFSIA